MRAYWQKQMVLSIQSPIQSLTISLTQSLILHARLVHTLVAVVTNQKRPFTDKFGNETLTSKHRAWNEFPNTRLQNQSITII